MDKDQLDIVDLIKKKCKDKKFCNWLHNKECIICKATETTCGHHLEGRLRDDLQIPLCWKHHTGEKGIHTIGKQTWYKEYYSKEICYAIADKIYKIYKNQ